MQLYIIEYLSDFCASLSYYFANKVDRKFFYSASEVFAYSNIYIIIFLILMNPVFIKRYQFSILNFKNYLQNKKIYFPIFLSVSSAFLKTIILSKTFQEKIGTEISQLSLRGYTIFCPLITILLCHFFLKDQKINRIFFISSAISLFGFFVFNLDSASFSQLHVIIFSYVFINSYSDYKLKAISKIRNFEMILFDNLMFLVISFAIFIVACFNEDLTKSIFQVSKFNINKLFNLSSFCGVFIVSFLSFFAHNFKMISYKIRHISIIMITSIFFKSFNSILITYIEKSQLPNFYKILGISIMTFGLSFFIYKNYQDKKSMKN